MLKFKFARSGMESLPNLGSLFTTECGFMQDTVAEMAKNMKSNKTGATQASASELYDFMKRVGRSLRLSSLLHGNLTSSLELDWQSHLVTGTQKLCSLCVGRGEDWTGRILCGAGEGGGAGEPV